MGADAICIKDMSGILSLMTRMICFRNKKEVNCLSLTSHYTSGMASMTYLKAIEASDVVDNVCAFALRLPCAIEPLVAALQETERASAIDLKKIAVAG